MTFSKSVMFMNEMWCLDHWRPVLMHLLFVKTAGDVGFLFYSVLWCRAQAPQCGISKLQGCVYGCSRQGFWTQACGDPHVKDLQASNKGFVFVAFACQARILLPEGESDRLCSTFTNLYVCHVTAVCRRVWSTDWKGVPFKCSWLEGIYGFAISWKHSTRFLIGALFLPYDSFQHAVIRLHAYQPEKKKLLHWSSSLCPQSFTLHCQVRGLIMHLSMRV